MMLIDLLGKELLAAVLVTLCALVFLRFLAPSIGLLDKPGERKKHLVQTPLIGGVSIYLGLLTLGITEQVVYAEYIIIINVSFILMLVGILDDAYELTTRMRLLFQGVGGLVIYLGGLQFHDLGNLVFSGAISLGFLSLPFTLIAVVGGVNAINMMDGLDGLAGGMVLTALFFLGIFAYLAQAYQMLIFISILVAALAVFLMFNYRFPWRQGASIFLGDGGAYALGFILACLFIKATQGEDAFVTPILMLWILAIPLMDTAGVIWRRLRRGRLPVTPGRDHLHHLLLDRGVGERKAVLLLHGAGFVIAGTGAIGFLLGVPEGVLFIGFLTVCVAYFSLTSSLQPNTAPLQKAHQRPDAYRDDIT